MAEIQVPEAPSIPNFPEKKRAEWKQSFVKAFKQAVVDHPGDETTQRAVATREANRVFRVDEPVSYEEAQALEEWQCLHRSESSGQLKVVTIDAKKYCFDIPAKAAKAAGAKKEAEDEKEPEGQKAAAGNNGNGARK